MAKATPYTRGSTQGVAQRLISYAGYPVHAGIDLLNTMESCTVNRLPRTRGDRPDPVDPGGETK